MVSVPYTLVTPVDCDNPPVKPDPVGTDHVYNVPDGITPFTTSVGVTLKATPLQVVAVIAVIVAPGLSVTIIVKADPLHEPDNGVTI